MELSEKQRDRLLRWRLVLGEAAEQSGGAPGLPGLDGEGLAELSPQELEELDRALHFLYGSGGAGGDLSDSAPYLPKWLGDIRGFFSKEVVALLQKDAIERRGLQSLLFEPEALPHLARNVDLAATLLAMKDMIPHRARDTARQLIREIVDELRKKLELEIRQTVLGARTRNRHSPMRSANNLDVRRTIARNLKNWDPATRRIIPERFYFWANQRRFAEWDLIIAVDQSGSMGTSVIYSSVMAAIFASLDAMRTKLFFFDTSIADMTGQLSDPVEVIFGAQLGGGTDIGRAVAYGADLVERPDKTIFLLITDLEEGGDHRRMLSRLAALVESRVRVLCLLALTDGGVPHFDHAMAREVSALGIPTFGCTPKRLVAIMERLLRNQPYDNLAAGEPLPEG